MPRFEMVPQPVDAMQFDETRAGVERVIAWTKIVAPSRPVRPRTEHRGWEDLTGYLELELRNVDQGCTAGDWVLVTFVEKVPSVWIIDDASFRKYYRAL